MQTIALRAYHARDRDLIIRPNPVPYFAPYFGYKSHFDQNEKIVLIYQWIFRPALVKYGLDLKFIELQLKNLVKKSYSYNFWNRLL